MPDGARSPPCPSPDPPPRDELGPFDDLVHAVEDGEEGNANVRGDGGGHVDRVGHEVVQTLQEADDDPQRECEDGPERVQLCAVGKVVQRSSLGDVGLAESVMGCGNATPCDKSCKAGEVEEPGIDDAVSDEGCEEREGADKGGGEERVDWDASLGHLLEDCGGLALKGEVVEYATRSVETRVACGEDGGDDDGVHDVRGGLETGLEEDEGERRDGDGIDGGIEEVRVVVGDYQADDKDGKDVEEEDAPEDLLDRCRHILSRILRFSRRHAHKLRPLERESGNEEDA
ncbi:LOW QUALITY PROTEIN: hypothetical protein BC936DRAFT_149792 [Jimgerdemannia flammicorona]|uniref:Uncharacterized protein n=1 Tax=Jimgerdemannia flammicorona TaxID=994334 RepID=A0A433D048_9FUNG|nr:LOW QUALITY PROTEIN: hypothetical protein BC936DRAFT_149792 [Jimgerdemannia flammicorona]